jgi:hypothetical protein
MKLQAGEEIGGKGFKWIWDTYGEGIIFLTLRLRSSSLETVSLFLLHPVLSADFLRARFFADIDSAALSHLRLTGIFSLLCPKK